VSVPGLEITVTSVCFALETSIADMAFVIESRICWDDCWGVMG